MALASYTISRESCSVHAGILSGTIANTKVSSNQEY